MSESTLAANALPGDEDRIRAARARSNAAIARHDIEGIAAFWMDDVIVLGSTSVQIAGAQANRVYYREQFARRPDTVWVRTPSRASVMSAWGVGLEEGDWTGGWTEPDGPVRVGGRYMAQWVQDGGEWRIQGELYVPTSCTGSAFCAQPPRRQAVGRP